MDAQRNLQPLRPQAQNNNNSPVLILVKSALAALVLLIATSAIVSTYSNAGIPLFSHASDAMSEQQRHDRLTAFNAIIALPLAFVSENDLPKAIESMQLDPHAKEILQKDLGVTNSVVSSIPTAVSQKQATATPQATPQPAAATQERRLRLAWITLWDTNAEDGDVVRLDSQGYSRTVVLRKQPVTFAVPVPSNGIVNVVGIRDGDGGGITVGLASGEARAVFPIMSEGQTLGLRVRIN